MDVTEWAKQGLFGSIAALEAGVIGVLFWQLRGEQQDHLKDIKDLIKDQQTAQDKIEEQHATSLGKLSDLLNGMKLIVDQIYWLSQNQRGKK